MQKQIDLAELASVVFKKSVKRSWSMPAVCVLIPRSPRNCGGPTLNAIGNPYCFPAWASSVSSWSLRTMRRLCKIQFLTFYSGKRAVFDPIAHLWDTLSLRRHP